MYLFKCCAELSNSSNIRNQRAQVVVQTSAPEYTQQSGMPYVTFCPGGGVSFAAFGPNIFPPYQTFGPEIHSPYEAYRPAGGAPKEAYGSGGVSMPCSEYGAGHAMLFPESASPLGVSSQGTSYDKGSLALEWHSNHENPQISKLESESSEKGNSHVKFTNKVAVSYFVEENDDSDSTNDELGNNKSLNESKTDNNGSKNVKTAAVNNETS